MDHILIRENVIMRREVSPLFTFSIDPEMRDIVEEVAHLLGNILVLHKDESEEDDGTSKMQSNLSLIEVITKYRQEDTQATELNSISEYLYGELSQNFINIGETEDNFDITNAKSWEELFSIDSLPTALYYTIAIQIILNLTYLSLVNKQKLAKVPKIKSLIQKLLDTCTDTLLQEVLIDLYCQILSVDSTPSDILHAYNKVSEGSRDYLQILNTIENGLCDPYSQSYLQFENTYELVPFKTARDKFTVQLWVMINNLTSSRILTINSSIYLEIKQSTLCISNDEFILALFQNFEFESSKIYQISLNVNGDHVSLYVDGNHVETISLIQDSIKDVKQLELGSMICSFRLYRLWVWSDLLYETSIKLTSEIGLFCHRRFCQNDSPVGYPDLFGGDILQEVYKTIETPGVTYGICAQHVKQLTYDNLLISLDPREFIHTNKSNDGRLLVRVGNSSDVELGKCYYYQQSNILASLISLNAPQKLLYLINQCEDQEMLFGLLENLFIMLKCPDIKMVFENEVGHILLGSMLTKKILPKLKTTLPIQFLNLFLDYCGWNTDDPSWSILRHETAYDTLVINFELWISSTRNGEQTGSIEIIRFLFFQITELVKNSKFARFNARKLKSIGVLNKLLYHQHLIFTKTPNENFLTVLKGELCEVYKILLNDELTQEVATSMCYFAYYELRQGYYKSSEIILQVLNAVFFEAIDFERLETINILTSSFSIKAILTMMDYSYDTISILELLLQILLKLLQVNSHAYQKFIKNNGYSLLFEIMKKHKLKNYTTLINILRLYAIGEFISSDELLSATTFNREGLAAHGTILMLENHYLAIDLIEWAVINDITESVQEEMNEYLYYYMKSISEIQEHSPLCNILNPKETKFLEKSMDLLMTLKKSQNGVTYKKASEALIFLLSNNVFNSLTSLNTTEFEGYLEALLRGNSHGDRSNGSSSSDRATNYLKPAFWIGIFPDILERLANFAPTFDLLFGQYKHMFSNIVYMLSKYSETLALFEWDLISCVLVHKCVVSAAEGILRLPHIPIKSSTKNSLIQTEISILTTLFFLMMNEKFPINSSSANMFFESLLFHQETLFGFNKQFTFFDKEFISFFLSLLGRYIDASDLGSCHLALNCFRTIVLHCSESLIDISCSIDRCHKTEVLHFLESTMSSNDEDIYESFKTEKISAIFDRHSLRFHRKYIKPRLLELRDGDLLTASETMGKLLQLKHTCLEKWYNQIQKIHNIFHVDSIAMDLKILSIEERKLSYFMNDLEDTFVLYAQQMNKLVTDVMSRSRFQDDLDVELAWSLDSMENSNRMKKRLVPKYRTYDVLAQETDEANQIEDENLENSQRPPAVTSGRRCSSVMSFELISDLEAFDLNILDAQDKNRKILKILKENDTIKQIWNCSRVIGLSISEGVLIMSANYLYFFSNYFFSSRNKNIIELRDAPKNERDNTIGLVSGTSTHVLSEGFNHEIQFWELSNLVFATKRPFLLRDLAIEFLFENGKSCFFTFHTKALREDAYQKLEKIPKSTEIDPVFRNALIEINARNYDIGIRNGLSQLTFSSKVASVFSNTVDLTKSFDALKRWKNGEISNFYYLMIVNTLAGRTFNDLTQYPVFPWVIADYTSDELNFNDPKTFRDLSKPMGAQSEKRRKQFVERYEALASLNDPGAPPFHYGTHYSSAMIVSSFLIRLEPFVDSYLILQDGKFGHADRLFNNIERTWCSAAHENSTDVRELTPEFYYLPDFLTNINKYDFGALQNGERVNDVILPPWAKGDAKIFIDKNREALESPYVSKNLHKWIDLIFGYKQKGKEAEEAVNVFNKLSYPGAVNLDKINDENERRAVTGIIHNFGQTPLQIFDGPHPSKIDFSGPKLNENVWNHISEIPITTSNCRFSNTYENGISHICQEYSVQGVPSWEGYPFWYRPLHGKLQGKSVEISNSCSLSIAGQIFHNIHFCPITALCLFKNNQIFTGDASGLLKLWKYTTGKVGIELEEVTAFYGHLYAIKQLHASSEYNTLVSLDAAGKVYCWDILRSEILRQISKTAMHCYLSNSTGSIVAIDSKNKLSIYDLNGSLYADKQFTTDISTASLVDFIGVDRFKRNHIYWKEKEIITVGFSSGEIQVLELCQNAVKSWDLKPLKKLSSGNTFPITCIYGTIRVLSLINGSEPSVAVAKCEIVCGNTDGSIYVWR